MINLNVSKIYLLDLADDISANVSLDLYELIGKDAVKAFAFGLLIEKIWNSLDKMQQLLYSKQLRHIGDSLINYKDQLKFWNERFTKLSGEEVTLIDYSQYLLNNFFFHEETKDKDIINLALYLGKNAIEKLEKNEKNSKSADSINDGSFILE